MSFRFFQDVANKKTNGRIVHTDDKARADFFAKQARWKELVGDDVPEAARKATEPKPTKEELEAEAKAKKAEAEAKAKAKETEKAGDEGEEVKKTTTRRTTKTAD